MGRHPHILVKPGPLEFLAPGDSADEREALLRSHWKSLGKLQSHWSDLTASKEHKDGWKRFLYHHSFYHFFRDEWYHPSKVADINPRLHWDMARFLEPALLIVQKLVRGEPITTEDEKELIRFYFVPRGTRKTSFTNCFSPWVHLHEPLSRHLHMRSTIKKAYKGLHRIARFWKQAEVIHKIYPEYVVNSKIIKTKELAWGKDGLELPVDKLVNFGFTSQEASFEVCGLETSETGFHYDLFLPSDAVDISNFRTQVGRQRVKDKFTEMFSILEQGAAWVGDGTPWHRDDAYAWLQNEQLQAGDDGDDEDIIKCQIFHRKAIEDRFGYKDEPLYPEKLSRKRLRQLRRKLGSHVYNCQFNCEPMDPERAIFNMMCVNYFRIKDIAHVPLNIYVLFDDAAKTLATSSEKCIVVCGVDIKKNVYVLQVFTGRFARTKVFELFTTIYKFYKQWQNTRSFVCFGESIGGYDALRKQINDLVRPECPQFNLQPLPFNTRGGNKIMRIADFEPPVSDGKVFFRVKDKCDMEKLDPSVPESCEGFLYDRHFQQLWQRMRDITLDEDPKNTPLDDIDTLSMLMAVYNRPRAMKNQQNLDERPGGLQSLTPDLYEQQIRARKAEERNEFLEEIAANPNTAVMDLLARRKNRERITPEMIQAEDWMN